MGINRMLDAVEIEIAANSIPFENFKQHEVNYGVQYHPGIPMNFSLNRYNEKAGYKQNPYIHNSQMKDFIKEGLSKGMSLDEAKLYAEQMDKQINKDYWNKDSVLRKPITPGSSVISDAKILNNGDIELTFGNRKSYTYNGGTDPDKTLMDLLTSPSIGNQISKKPGNWASRHRRG